MVAKSQTRLSDFTYLLTYFDLTHPVLWLTDTLSRTNAQTETQYDNVRQESRQSPFDIWPFATVVEAVIHPYEVTFSVWFGFFRC